MRSIIYQQEAILIFIPPNGYNSSQVIYLDNIAIHMNKEVGIVELLYSFIKME